MSTIIQRIVLCVLIATIASLIASVCTKAISTNFYRSTHFKKLHEALGSEFKLKVPQSASHAIHQHINVEAGLCVCVCVPSCHPSRADMFTATAPPLPFSAATRRHSPAPVSAAGPSRQSRYSPRAPGQMCAGRPRSCAPAIPP